LAATVEEFYWFRSKGLAPHQAVSVLAMAAAAFVEQIADTEERKDEAIRTFTK